MGYLEGFGVTFREMFRDRLTTEYPKEKREKSVRWHGRHVLNRYEDGMEKCIGCEWDPLESTCRHASLSIL